MNLLKSRIAAFCVVGLALGSTLLGCNLQVSFPGEGSKETQEDQASTASNSNEPSPAPASSSSTPVAAAAKPVSATNGSLPAGYILDETCEIGTGQTGLDIYYKLAPSDSLRYACVHRVGESPLINYEDSAFLQNLREVGGPYCAFSSVSNNVGCALSPITTADLMNVPPLQEEEQEQPVKSKAQPKQSKQTVQKEQPAQDQQSSPSNDNAGGVSNDRYYKNVDGIDVHSPAHSTDGSVPEGATAQCADGTYSFSLNRRGTCSSHGGVSRWLQ